MSLATSAAVEGMQKIGVFSALRGISALRDRADILTFHRVGADLDSYLEPIPTPLFEKILDHVAARYELVPLATIVGAVNAGRSMPRKAMAITFDDGYRDNYEQALPLLEERRIPATFFLVAGNIEDRVPFWWDSLHHSLHAFERWPDDAELNQASFPSGIAKLLATGPPADATERRAMTEHIVRAARSVSDEERRSILADLHDRLRVPAEAAPLNLLDWDDVVDAHSRGIDIGGHTLTHPALDRISPAAVGTEVGGGARLIKERTEIRPTHFAYPGGSGSTADLVHEVIRTSGFVGAVTNIPGPNSSKTDPLLLRRHSVANRGTAVLDATITGLTRLRRVRR